MQLCAGPKSFAFMACHHVVTDGSSAPPRECGAGSVTFKVSVKPAVLDLLTSLSSPAMVPRMELNDLNEAQTPTLKRWQIQGLHTQWSESDTARTASDTAPKARS